MLKLSGYQLTDLAKSDQTDQAKKVLRYVGEAVRRIEEKHQGATRVEDVFTMELVTLRARLKDFTKKLVITDPIKSGTKAMEIYWRKAFHEPVSLARQLRGTSTTNSEIGLVESHLMTGFEHYHHEIVFLAEHFAGRKNLFWILQAALLMVWGFLWTRRRVEMSLSQV